MSAADLFSQPDVAAAMREIGAAARAAARILANAPASRSARAPGGGAAAARAQRRDPAANARTSPKRKARGHHGVPRPAEARREARRGHGAGLEDIAALPDPVGRVLRRGPRPNGMRIERVAVPLGVIGMIYESRPNVTADAGALCLKTGNAVILRGGSESFRSAAAITLPGRGPWRGRPARGRDRAGADHRPRRGRHDARRARRRHRRDRAARRQEPGRAGAARSARAGVRRISKASATSMSTRPPIWRWPKRSCSTPRCAAPASAAPPRRCWSTAPARRHTSASRWSRC